MKKLIKTNQQVQENIAEVNPSLLQAVEFIGTESNTIVIHEGPLTRIPNILDANNDHLQNNTLNTGQISIINRNREYLFSNSVENIVICIMNSCINLRGNVDTDSLNILSVGEVNGFKREANQEDIEIAMNKYSVDNLYQYLYSTNNKLNIIPNNWDILSVFKNVDERYIVELASLITVNLYNILASLIVTEADLYIVKAIIDIFHEKVTIALLQFKKDSFPSYKLNYLNEKEKASRSNKYDDEWY